MKTYIGKQKQIYHNSLIRYNAPQIQSTVARTSELGAQTDTIPPTSAHISKSLRTGVASSETHTVSFEAVEPKVQSDVNENIVQAQFIQDKTETKSLENISKQVGV